MARRVLVVGLESVRERLHGREERALEALEARRRLERETRLPGDAREELELAVLVARPERRSPRRRLPSALRPRTGRLRNGPRCPRERTRSRRSPPGPRCTARGDRATARGARRESARGRARPAVAPGSRRAARAIRPSPLWSQTDDARAVEDAHRACGGSLRDLAMPEASARSRENSSSAFALSASRRCDSYSRAFSSATDACPAMTSSSRRSSASNWSRPSFEMTITPVTRGPYLSGTARSDSSISAVPSICSPNSCCAASPTSRDVPVSATRPVIPRPTFVGRSFDGIARRRRRSGRRGRRPARGRRRRGGRRGSCGSRRGAGARPRS